VTHALLDAWSYLLVERRLVAQDFALAPHSLQVAALAAQGDGVLRVAARADAGKMRKLSMERRCRNDPRQPRSRGGSDGGLVGEFTSQVRGEGNRTRR
jgi:hypothetical protein